MHGTQLTLLRRRFEASGQFRAVAFSYPTVRNRMADHVRSLIDFAQAQKTDELHFVGHSLGGLVTLNALRITDDLPPGRVVLLGPPLQGSLAAQGLARRVPFGREILGRAALEELVDWKPREWSGRRDVGVIAGSTTFGLGRLFAKLGSDHDGTVLVKETMLPGSKQHLVMRTTHTGMVFSRAVAAQTEHFLLNGRFDTKD